MSLRKNQPKDMAKEIKKFKDSIYLLNTSGNLIKINIEALNQYNHSKCELHHFIPYNVYIQNPQWFEERGIKQKLILVSKVCHEHIENRGIKVLSDEEFYNRYHIKRTELLFKRGYEESNY